MWSFINSISLIRYLFVWRINRALVRMPNCLSAEISIVLGSIITDRLPTREAGQWRKALLPWEEYQSQNAKVSGKKKKKLLPVPEVTWPIETVLFAYPGKRNYGPDELLLWELKLIGDDANHGLFLEIILPAIEEAGSTSNPHWYRPNSLWGRFDVQAVFAARGPRWEPVVNNGRLDLGYHAGPLQWAEGLAFDQTSERTYKHLTWITPFDLSLKSGETGPLSVRPAGSTSPSTSRRRRQKEIPPDETPTLQRILEACLARMAVLLPGKYNTPGDVWNALSSEEQSSLQEAIEQVYHLPVQRKDIKPAPKDWPGRWIGSQTFPSSVPSSIIPYLQLASILHIGRQTHFGCGTFMMTNR